MKKLEIFEYLKNVASWTCDEQGNVFNKRGRKINYVSNKGYIRSKISIDKKQYHVLIHQYVFWYHNNFISDQVDHIDNDRSNNNPNNLRSVTNQENQFNRSNVKGYFFDKKSNKFRAQITLDGRKMCLGFFTNESEARYTYIQAKNKYHKIECNNKTTKAL